MEEELMIGVMAAMIGIAMAIGIASVYVEAAPPVFTCPICGATFSSLEELETHFEVEHPAEPISIIWES